MHKCVRVSVFRVSLGYLVCASAHVCVCKLPRPFHTAGGARVSEIERSKSERETERVGVVAVFYFLQ